MRVRKRLGIVAVASVAVVLGAAAPGVTSSHREAPLILNEPQLDNTDTYAFVSPDKPDTVTIIANWVPIQEPSGGPNYYPFSNNARYNVHIDNNGDTKPDITYRWTFKSSLRDPSSFLYNVGPVNNLDDETLNFRQTYTLERIAGGQTTALLTDAKVAPSNVGVASMPNYAALHRQAITPFGNNGVSFAGQADDPFFLDLRVFDLLYGTDLKEAGNDTLTNYNVNAIALQVPKNELAMGGDAKANTIIGIWSDTERPAIRTQSADGKETFSGDFVRVSRLGMPLVNEVVIDLARKDLFNSSTPETDGQFLERVQKPLVPKLIEKIYGIKAPPEPRDDLVAVFLTGVKDLNMPPNVKPGEMIRLNMAIPPTASPKRLGVLDGDTAGFPNGRRLADDVVDIELQVLEGELLGTKNDLGDGVNDNDKPFQATFPYVALPAAGSTTEPRATRVAAATNTGTAAAPGTGVRPRGGIATGAGGLAGTPLLPAGAVLGGLGLAAWAFLPRRRSAAPTD